MKQYYYFVTGLPELSIGMERLPFSMAEYIEMIRDEITGDELEIINNLLYHFDNQNLVNLLEGKDEFNPLGNIPKALLEEESKIPMILPSYMQEFLEAHRLEQRENPDLSLENELTLFYHNWLLNNDNLFIQKYARFEHDLKNVLVALNCRKHNVDLGKNVLPINEEADVLKQSSASDFGLGYTFDWISEVIAVYNESDILQLEKKLDAIRLAVVDSILDFEYFTINKIAGYMIKLMIIDRWMQIDKGDGEEVFETMTEELSNIEHVLQEYNS